MWKLKFLLNFWSDYLRRPRRRLRRRFHRRVAGRAGAEKFFKSKVDSGQWGDAKGKTNMQSAITTVK